tara:strand:- start:142 stop:336 length:195 start_codon:yes stop_codon:yes gene_type:complete
VIETICTSPSAPLAAAPFSDSSISFLSVSFVVFSSGTCCSKKSFNLSSVDLLSLLSDELSESES